MPRRLLKSALADALGTRKNCGTCDGAGGIDSGAVDQAGRPILRPCPECREVDHLRRLYRAMARRCHRAEENMANLMATERVRIPPRTFDAWIKVVERELLERGPDPE